MPLARVPVVVVFVPLPPPGSPVIAAAFVDVAPAGPDVAAMSPSIMAVIVNVAWPLYDALFARRRRFISPSVNDHHRRLRGRYRER
jgi:hypothetical protein